MRRIFHPILPEMYPVTSTFSTPRPGGTHEALDIACPIGTPITSPWPGVIDNVYINAVGGRQLIILHKNGYKTGYAHLNDTYVVPGEVVKAGDYVADSGNTGHTTGPHLHFTMRNPTGQRVDPIPYYDGSYNKALNKTRIEHASMALGLFSLILTFFPDGRDYKR